MLRTAVVSAAALILSFICAVAVTADVTITSPPDKAEVFRTPTVRGTSTTNQPIWVVVHPTNVPEFYVQPPVKRSGKNQWLTTIYIGRSGKIDVGKYFEIMAVENPEGNLREGQILGGWPAGAAYSDIVTVRRK